MSNVARMAQRLTVPGVVPTWHQGDYLRKAREHAGMSQSELAEVTGISRRTISRYESEVAVVRQRPQLIAWAMATGVPLSWLLDGENPRPDDPDGGDVLPRLDLNQRPSDYMSSQVAEVPDNVVQGPWRVPVAVPA